MTTKYFSQKLRSPEITCNTFSAVNTILTGNTTINAEDTVDVKVEKGEGELFTVKEVDGSTETSVFTVTGNYIGSGEAGTVVGGKGLLVNAPANLLSTLSVSSTLTGLGNVIMGGDLEGSATTIVKTNYINPVVTTGQPGVLYIANEPSTSGTMEVSITDRANSVASLSLLEHVPGSTSAYAKFGDSAAYGAQLIYDGDNPNDSDDEVRLDTCSGNTISNIFKVGRDSGNFTLSRDLRLDHSNPRIEGGGTSSDMTIHSGEDLTLSATGNISLSQGGNLFLNFNQIPVDTDNSSVSFTLGVKNTTGEVYRHDTGFFTGTHIYASDTNIPTGMAVELSSGKVALASTPNSKICVGVVTLCRELGADEVHSTSLGSDVTGGYICRLASVGDPLDRQCTGLNICNENGDIQPGDLLVTSSTPGYLMKQSDDIIKSITVGKAMEAVTFDTNGQATGVYGFLYCG